MVSFANPINLNNYSCEIFAAASKSMQYYCGDINCTISAAFNKLIAGSPINIEQLKMAGCDSSLTLKTIQKHPDIHSIDLSYSAYTSLDWLDIQLDHLTNFNASHNELSAMPNGLFNKAPELIAIDLSHNSFTELRPNIFRKKLGSLPKLTYIYLSHNKITSIESDTFGELTNLKFIDLSNNLLNHVYGVFRNQKNVVVNLRQTPITGFSCSNFKTASAELTRIVGPFGHSL